MTKLKPNQFILGGHLITERPILFQTDMVKAILDDRKTQTRRGRNLDRVNQYPNDWELSQTCESQINVTKIKIGDFAAVFNSNIKKGKAEFIKSPYGKPGDLLWVKETWAYFSGIDSDEIVYKSDGLFDTKAKEHLVANKWKPSIHMPKSASRIWVMIEDIYPERLQDINEEHAIAEGIKELTVYPFAFYKDYLGKNDGYQHPIFSFNSLWISINGRESFDANPWVWVIKFRVLSKTGRPSNETILAFRLSLLPTEGRSASQRKEVTND